jgi:tetratricopeptide (TPR) repeat protein
MAMAWVSSAVAQAPGAQDLTAEEHLALGDAAHLAMDAPAALAQYDAAAQAAEGSDSPTYGEALEKASREAVAVAGGDPELSDRQRSTFFRRAEGYARRAMAARPGSAEAHFQLALALGSVALTVGPREQVQYATLIREEAIRALNIDPRHSGAMHVLGMWNAEVMRLNSVSRFVAENVLGGSALAGATWEDAQRYLEQAVAIDPNRIAHRLDLAMIYADRGMEREAREQFEWIQKAPVTEYNDPSFKQIAARALASLA